MAVLVSYDSFVYNRAILKLYTIVNIMKVSLNKYEKNYNKFINFYFFLNS